MDFSVARHGYFNVAHCYDCLEPGNLIVPPIVPTRPLAALSRTAQQELGPVLAAATKTVRRIIAPQKIYCTQFGEENQQLHFHVFPRTTEMTNEFIRAFPEQ